MSNETAEDYKYKMKELEDETAKASEQALINQEERLHAVVREMTQSITTMSRDNELVDLTESNGKNDDVDQHVINSACMGEKIEEFNKLIELLKLTHLEQETLDYFLRYTISSSDLLQLNSIYDKKYVDLENKVNTLEQQILETNHQEIEETKQEIFNTSEDLAKAQDRINETYLETTHVLDDCYQMITELETLREGHKIRKEELKKEKDPILEIYNEWELLRETTLEYRALEEQTKRSEIIKKSYENRVAGGEAQHSESDPKVIEVCSTLDHLIRLWQSKFLPKSGWKNLEIYPQTRKFQFEVSNIFTVIITLDERKVLNDVEIYKKNDKTIGIDQTLQTKFKQENLGTRDIYNAMEHIIKGLQNIAEEN